MAFFHQKHELSPEKKRFFWLSKMQFFKVKKKYFFLYKVRKHLIFLVLFWSNLNKEKNFSFGKADFLDFEKFCFLRPKKVFFSLQSQKALFLGLVWSNLNKEKIGIFWPKAWVNPDFLEFEKFSFYSQKRFLFSLQTKKALFLVLFD